MVEFSVDEALRRGSAAFKNGQFQLADKFFSAVLSASPSNAHANHNKGVLIEHSRGPATALPFFRKALESNASVGQFWASFIAALIKLHRPVTARKALKRALGRGVNDASLVALERRLEALERLPVPPRRFVEEIADLYERETYRAAIDKIEGSFDKYRRTTDLFMVLGSSHVALRDYRSAVFAFQQVTEMDPSMAVAWGYLGVAQLENGAIDAAIPNLMRAIEKRAGHREIFWSNLGNAYQKKGDFDAAIERYEKSLSINSNYAEAHFNMGVVLRAKEQFELAMDSFERAIEANSKFGGAYEGIVDMLEKRNKIDELEVWLRTADDNLGGLTSNLLFHKAKLLFRNDRLQEALKILETIDAAEDLTINRATIAQLIGKCTDKLGKYDQAYSSFMEMNRVVRSGPAYDAIERDSFFATNRAKLERLKATENESTASLPAHPDFLPTFLVGFPRSGTTLLDTILRSHSSIEVIEEKPTLSAAAKAIQQAGEYDVIKSFPVPDIGEHARNAYLEEFKKHASDEFQNKQYIDKMPLNLLHINLSNYLFQNAKYVLAIRHPFDCILSNWMQNYSLNPSMANMDEIERIVDFYCLAMETFFISAKKYQSDYHIVRYEDLVEDMQGEATRLLHFLGLDWEDALSDYQTTALNRGRIRTPSYAQVVKPIYRESIDRWKNYGSYLEQHFPKITPWVDHFGYASLTL